MSEKSVHGKVQESIEYRQDRKVESVKHFLTAINCFAMKDAYCDTHNYSEVRSLLDQIQACQKIARHYGNQLSSICSKSFSLCSSKTVRWFSLNNPFSLAYCSLLAIFFTFWQMTSIYSVSNHRSWLHIDHTFSKLSDQWLKSPPPRQNLHLLHNCISAMPSSLRREIHITFTKPGFDQEVSFHALRIIHSLPYPNLVHFWVWAFTVVTNDRLGTYLTS